METGKDHDRTNRVVVVAAVASVLAFGTVAALWGLGVLKENRTPATCSGPGPNDPAAAYQALCAALNRPDLPTLLGTPDDHVSTAQPGTFANGVAMAEVRLQRSVVGVSDSQTSVWSMADTQQFHAERATVLGHPAVTYSGHALKLFPSNGKSGGDGPVTRNIVVAWDPKDPGGRAYEFTVFRQDGQAPDDAALRRVAETVLPTLPGWVAAQ
ncbi:MULTISPECIES: DUF6215 domain-containing protein [unclassified Kitasatospora]|uniref:DUF6215 domain-containing protein n=1 Tax=unclassified Kitasatospora TaxID=2633591 RepID=UPI0033F6EAAD